MKAMATQFNLVKADTRPRLPPKALIVLVAALGINACGGGGSGNNVINDPVGDEQPIADDDGVITDANSDSDDNGNDDDNIPTNQVPNTDNTDNDVVDDTTADIDADEMVSDTQDDQNNSPDPSGVFIFMERGEAAPGPGDGTLGPYVQRNVDIDDAGNMVFLGRLEEDRISNRTALWGGTIFSPVRLLTPGATLEGFPPTVLLSSVENASLGSSGDVVAVVELGGADTERAIVMFDQNNSPVVVARTGDAVIVGEESISIDSLSGAEIDRGVVAFNSDSTLFVKRDELLDFIAPSTSLASSAEVVDRAPIQADGCRILYVAEDQFATLPNNFAVAPDGSVVFNGKVTVERAASSSSVICPQRRDPLDPTQDFTTQQIDNLFDSVVRYTPVGAYDRIVSRGDTVPGMSAVFSSVSFLSMLKDGTIVVRAQMLAHGGLLRGVESLWHFDLNNKPRLIAIEGESFQTLSGSSTLEVGQFGSTLSMPNTESVAVRIGGSVSNPDSGKILFGSIHPGQPYEDLFSLGESPLKLLVEIGSVAPQGYPETAFFSGIGAVTAKSGGGGYFFGSIAEASAPDEVLDSGVWVYDSNGVITPFLLNGDTYTLNEIPRELKGFSSPSRERGPFVVGDNAIIVKQTAIGEDRLVYWPGR